MYVCICIYIYIYMYLYIYIYVYVYIRRQSKSVKMHKTMKIELNHIKQFLETLFLAIKMCTDFPTDVIWINTMCGRTLNQRVYVCYSSDKKTKANLIMSVSSEIDNV